VTLCATTRNAKKVLKPVIPREIALPVDRASTSGGERQASLAVLLSGTGRTLENFLQVIDRGELDARIAVVISSISGVGGLTIAVNANVPAFVLRRQEFPSDQAYSEAIYAAIAPYDPDLILLAGFLRRLVVFPEWQGRILNIHPGLLPGGPAGRGLYGERVHAAVLASGVSESGATVHVVDDDYDTGPVVMRATVPVLPDDTPGTLGARVFAAECDLYPEAVRRYLGNNPHLRRRSVPVATHD
jgi:phosphoribosylglycinamide formyltransferase 1